MLHISLQYLQLNLTVRYTPVEQHMDHTEQSIKELGGRKGKRSIQEEKTLISNQNCSDFKHRYVQVHSMWSGCLVLFWSQKMFPQVFKRWLFIWYELHDILRVRLWHRNSHVGHHILLSACKTRFATVFHHFLHVSLRHYHTFVKSYNIIYCQTIGNREPGTSFGPLNIIFSSL